MTTETQICKRYQALALSHLDQLEAQAIHILREVRACFERPALLYSIGKDSSVLLRLARKAFHPGKIPFAVIHVDTGYKFPEMLEFRDETADELGLDLTVHRNESAIAAGTSPEAAGTQRCCSLLKTRALLDVLKAGAHDAAIGGARRDEERSRAKERVFSFRDDHGQWFPRKQRPELWNLYNTRIHPGESIRVFPLSNWRELDVWNYVHREKIRVSELYFARERQVIERGDMLIPSTAEGSRMVSCRYRSLGCQPCTGAIPSTASNVAEIIEETLLSQTSERSSRLIDHDVSASMEKKKREGYF